MNLEADDSSDLAAADAIRRKLHRLVSDRSELVAMKAEVERRLLQNEKDLMDCQAAGRLFGLDLPLPRRTAPPPPPRPSSIGDFKLVSTATVQDGPTVEQGALFAAPAPTIRDLVLQYLTQAGPKGAKVGQIRKHVETVLRRQVHYKTVGMTLYRLTQENAVQRVGFIWSLVPKSSAGTKEPGSEPPGPVNVLD